MTQDELLKAAFAELVESQTEAFAIAIAAISRQLSAPQLRADLADIQQKLQQANVPQHALTGRFVASMLAALADDPAH